MPWKALKDSPKSFFDEKYLPANVKLQEPSKLVKAEARAILDHWIARQSDGTQDGAFKFKAYIGDHDKVVPVEKAQASKDRHKGTRRAVRRPRSPSPPSDSEGDTGEAEHADADDADEHDEEDEPVAGPSRLGVRRDGGKQQPSVEVVGSPVRPKPRRVFAESEPAASPAAKAPRSTRSMQGRDGKRKAGGDRPESPAKKS